MKQIRLLSLCLLLCTVFASLKAQVNTQFDGGYSGTAYNIKMKGKLKPSQKMVFRLHNGVLTGAVPKIWQDARNDSLFHKRHKHKF